MTQVWQYTDNSNTVVTTTWPSGAVESCLVTAPQYLASVAGGATTNAAASPSASQQASTAWSAGIGITSTGTPSLNASYPCDPASQAKLNTLFALVTAGVVSAPISVADMTGAAHTFDNTQFTNFVGAVLKYASLINLIAVTNSGSLPSASATIP